MLFQLAHLQSIQLSGNVLHTLPDLSGYWDYLEELYIDKCQLEVNLMNPNTILGFTRIDWIHNKS